MYSNSQLKHITWRLWDPKNCKIWKIKQFERIKNRYANFLRPKSRKLKKNQNQKEQFFVDELQNTEKKEAFFGYKKLKTSRRQKNTFWFWWNNTNLTWTVFSPQKFADKIWWIETFNLWRKVQKTGKQITKNHKNYDFWANFEVEYLYNFSIFSNENLSAPKVHPENWFPIF